MTQQEVFDKMVAGLAAQGFQQSKANGRCAYRGENGRKCAIGHLLTDEICSSRNLEGLGMGSLDLRQAIVDSGYSLVGKSDLLWLTQTAHDMSKTPNVMKIRLRYVADRFNLMIPPALLTETV